MQHTGIGLYDSRGLQGVVRSGRSPGGRAYGYRPILGRPGELEIVEEEAVVIRQIFHDYVAGKKPREIAYALNKVGTRPPRGATGQLPLSMETKNAITGSS